MAPVLFVGPSANLDALQKLIRERKQANKKALEMLDSDNSLGKEAREEQKEALQMEQKAHMRWLQNCLDRAQPGWIAEKDLEKLRDGKQQGDDWVADERGAIRAAVPALVQVELAKSSRAKC